MAIYNDFPHKGYVTVSSGTTIDNIETKLVKSALSDVTDEMTQMINSNQEDLDFIYGVLEENKEDLDFIYQVLEENEKDLDDWGDWLIGQLNDYKRELKGQGDIIEEILQDDLSLKNNVLSTQKLMNDRINSIAGELENQIKLNNMKNTLLFNQLKSCQAELTQRKTDTKNLVENVKTENKLVVAYVEEDLYAKELLNLLIEKESIIRQIETTKNKARIRALNMLPWYKRIFRYFRDKVILEAENLVENTWQPDLDKINLKISMHTPENFRETIKDRIEKSKLQTK